MQCAAIVLAGGAATRMGGASKPTRTVGGQPMLTRVLDATADAAPRVVVGPLELVPVLPSGVSITVEQPRGGGPVAAVAAGLALLAAADPPLVAVFATDLPFLTPAAFADLRTAASQDDVDGAVLVDDAGHPQWLAGVWRRAALAARIPKDPAGTAMRRLVEPLRVARVEPRGEQLPAWFDCDTEDDLRRADNWADQARDEG
jgi:molybdopterin-guanine dinucleotide biosynthesis protein A